MPIASGTWGSMPTAAVFAGLCFLNVGLIVTSIVMIVIAAVFSFACVRFGDEVIEKAGKDDPSEIVADEAAGQAIAFLGAYATGTNNILIMTIAGFLLFRFFDILKPEPCRSLEKLHGGIGVLADDLMAGVYSAIVLQVGWWIYTSGVMTNLNSEMTVVSAVLLGAVQGLTEFLPVSSSGHLVLFEHILHFDPETPEMLIFDLITHVGTVIAILIIFRKSITGFVKNLLVFNRYGKNPVEIYRKSPSVRFLVLAIISTFITGVFGITFEKIFVSARGNLGLICIMWLITGTFLLITDYKYKTRMGLRKMGIICAVVIGLAQAGAIFPGISRSGATICAAVLLGLHRRWAIEYSFLLAMPAILGGTLITLIKDSNVLTESGLSAGILVSGALSACIVGVLALKLLIGVSKRKNFKIFAIYCYLLAFVVGVFLIFG
jgi:undecaprenyl-diphosphatase